MELEEEKAVASSKNEPLEGEAEVNTWAGKSARYRNYVCYHWVFLFATAG